MRDSVEIDNEELCERWDYIARSLSRVMKRVEKLPEREQDSEFSEWIERAFLHADSRADALIDPS